MSGCASIIGVRGGDEVCCTALHGFEHVDDIQLIRARNGRSPFELRSNVNLVSELTEMRRIEFLFPFHVPDCA